MELQRIVGAQTNVQADFEEESGSGFRSYVRNGAILLSGDWPNLFASDKTKTEERDLAQQNAVRYRMCCEECCRKMMRISSFTAIRSENEGV